MGRDVEERFWANVDKSGECWLWTRGVPVFRVGGKSVVAREWAYEQFVGPLVSGVEVVALCGRAGCVQPDHLALARKGARVPVSAPVVVAGAALPWACKHPRVAGQLVCLACVAKRERER